MNEKTQVDEQDIFIKMAPKNLLLETPEKLHFCCNHKKGVIVFPPREFPGHL